MAETIVQSVRKALDILDLLIFEDMERNGMTLTSLSQKTGLRPNTLHKLLKTMCQCGYAEQNKHQRYLAGKRCLQIGIINRFQITPSVSEVLHRESHRLCEKTGESVSFYVLDRGDRINYINVQCNHMVKVDYTMLEKDSMYAYPSGKILVSYCKEDELKKIIEKHGYPKERWNGANNARTLWAEIETVRTNGYAKRVSEEGVTSYAMPVFVNDTLLGTIGVYMPTFRWVPETEPKILSAMRETVKTIEQQIKI